MKNGILSFHAGMSWNLTSAMYFVKLLYSLTVTWLISSSPYENVTSLPGGIKTKGFHTEFHQISKLWDSRPLAVKVAVNLTAKYHILVLVHKTKRILAVTMELPIICMWHIASASNLAQG